MARHRRAGARRRGRRPENVCVRCDLKSLCDRCPATAILETGSPDGWIPHYCERRTRRAALLEVRDRRPGPRGRRYLAHADKVAAGWTPAGVTLPRASRLAQQRPPCRLRSGGCATGCCGIAPRGRPPRRSNLLSIERHVPSGDPPMSPKRSVRIPRRAAPTSRRASPAPPGARRGGAGLVQDRHTHRDRSARPQKCTGIPAL
jgi:hypothetical protein